MRDKRHVAVLKQDELLLPADGGDLPFPALDAGAGQHGATRCDDRSVLHERGVWMQRIGLEPCQGEPTPFQRIAVCGMLAERTIERDAAPTTRHRRPRRDARGVAAASARGAFRSASR